MRRAGWALKLRCVRHRWNPHRHSESGQQIEEHREPDVGVTDAVAPQQPHCCDQAGERPGHEHRGHRQLNGSLCPGLRLNIRSREGASAVIAA